MLSSPSSPTGIPTLATAARRRRSAPAPHFSVLVSAHDAAWETDQLMRFPLDRFKEHTSATPFTAAIEATRSRSLRALEKIPTLLLYESCVGGARGEIARFGRLVDVRLLEAELVFGFAEEGRVARSVVEAFADRLDLSPWQFNRTHWSIKVGGLPTDFLRQISATYDVVLSFAGENRRYVERVATHLRTQGVRVFYDGFEEASLWGKDLVEHLDAIYRRGGSYCVLFISAAYREKMWTIHERRSAYACALEAAAEYLLPARFDDTELPGLRPSVAYVTLAGKTPAALARLILAKLGRPPRPPQRKRASTVAKSERGG